MPPLRLQAGYARCIFYWKSSLEDRGSTLGHNTCRVDRILCRKRHTVQRTELPSRENGGFCAPGCFQCAVGDSDDCIDVAVDRFDAIEMRPHDFNRGDVLGPDELGEFGCVGIDQVVYHNVRP